MNALITTLLITFYQDQVFSINAIGKSRKFPHIQGGTRARKGSWPSLLSIQEDNLALWDHICGATLLTTTKALTAAHCIPNLSTKHRVQIGCSDVGAIDDCEETITIIEFEKHPEFNQELTDNKFDLAIITLEKAVKLNNYVKLASLSNPGTSFVNQTCDVAGWGEIDENDETSDLYEARIPLISRTACKAKLDGMTNVDVYNTQFCLFDDNHVVTACSEDFGGPVNCQSDDGRVIAGVMSWSLQGCPTNYPVIAIDIDPFREWINKTINS